MNFTVVLDTNVFISGIHWKGICELLLRKWINNEFQVIISPEIIEELLRVLKIFKIPMEEDKINFWKQLLIEKSTLVYPTIKLQVVRNDPDDNKFIEAAIDGGANFIVSQDKHLLSIRKYEEIKIVNPKEFLELLNS